MCINKEPHNQEELADKLFLSLCAGIEIDFNADDFKKLNLQILNEKGYTEFRPTLHAIIELCADGKTIKKRELLAKAYSWLGADYRKEAIDHINLYLNNDLHIADRKPFPLFVNGQEIWNIKDEDAFVCRAMLWDLAKAYEGGYLFNDALQTLEKSWDLFPYCYTTIAKICNIYKKMNKLGDAILLIDRELQEEWTQPYMHQDITGRIFYWDSSKRCLLADRDKYQKLIDKGYVYKPRCRKK